MSKTKTRDLLAKHGSEFVEKYTRHEFKTQMGNVFKVSVSSPDDEELTLVFTNAEGQEIALVFVEPSMLRDAISGCLRKQKRLREVEREGI